MKFRATREDLAAAFGTVSRIVESRHSIAILANIRVDVTADGVKLTGTDLDMMVETLMPADVSEPGSTTLPSGAMQELIRSLPKGADVTARMDAGGRVRVESGRCRAVLNAMTADDFPTLRSADDELCAAVTLPAKDFARMISRVIPVASVTQAHFAHLGSAYLHLVPGENVMRATALDGQRLAFSQMPVAPGSTFPGIILGRKVLGEIARLAEASDGTVEIAANDRKVVVTIGQTSLVAKLVEGVYPDYGRFLALCGSNTARIDADALRSALSRALVTAEGKYSSIGLTFSETGLALKSRHPDRGDVDEEIECELDGPPMKVSLNGKWACEALSVLDADTIEIALGDSRAPVSLTSVGATDTRYLIAPLMAAA